MLDLTLEIGWKDLASIFAASACGDVDIAIEYQLGRSLETCSPFLYAIAEDFSAP